MLDLDALLGPVSEDAPAGIDLREQPDDVTFAQVADMRREIDPAIDPDGARSANWPGVRAACEAALTAKTKDLRLAGWLTEALARTEGFAGLAAGLDAMRELLERYWDDVHPRGEDDGSGEISYEVRAGSVNWLAAPRGMLPSVRAIGILSGESDDRSEWLSWDSYLEAQRVDDAGVSNKARQEEMIASGAVTMKRWRMTGKATPVDRLVETHASLVEAYAALRRLVESCESRFPSNDQPSLLELDNLLSEITEWLAPKLPKSAGGAEPEAEPQEAEASDEVALDTEPVASAPRYAAAASSGPIGTRQEAFARLREVAEYFRAAEPHSPISILVDRAVRWGNLTFPQLLLEIVKTDESLTPVWDVLGIAAPSRDDQSAASSASDSSSDESPSEEPASSDDSDSTWGTSADE